VIFGPEALLVGAVAAVGVLHTIVPDHWVPITLVARQQAWSKGETARASLIAATGHVLSTLVIALVVWLAGVAFAEQFGEMVTTVSSFALIAFGGWIAVSSWRALDRGHGHGHRHDAHTHDKHAPDYDPLYAPSGGGTAVLTRHVHVHRHGSVHAHWHDHAPDSAHAVTADTESAPPQHAHRHKTSLRTALLLILGSSPMVEGIPAFFAAGKYGIGLIATMAAVFAVSTIATYMILCVYSAAGLQRVSLGSFEHYGEVMSGAFIAAVGAIFWVWPVL
jgi:ABC-type nickel/cobalt efflux system permease component RcnA